MYFLSNMLIKISMKKIWFVSLMAVLILSMSGCATIIGGSNYYAKVMVPDHPNAKIEYNGMYMGSGQTMFPVPRRGADKFAVTIKEDGNPDYYKRFYLREFRAWAFLGTLIGWTGVTESGILLPWGLVTDGLCGSWWKPSIMEDGVSKVDYKHFSYVIDYPYEPNKKIAFSNGDDNSSVSITKISPELKELKGLLDDGTITQEEFDAAKKKILER